MLVRSWKRLLPILGPFVIASFVLLKFFDSPQSLSSWKDAASKAAQSEIFRGHLPGSSSAIEKQPGAEGPLSRIGKPSEHAGTIPTNKLPPFVVADKHREIFSISTADKKFFPIDFGSYDAINPNIIPHPHFNDTWIIVAVRQRTNIPKSIFVVELTCDAKFKNGKLSCIVPPIILPIAATKGRDKCKDNLDFLNFNVGPHDGRVFYGPTFPMTIYGSQSTESCFGQWIHDFRALVDWGFEKAKADQFHQATELQRPNPGLIEKNWFIFWDRENNMYAHYDVWNMETKQNQRSFAQIGWNGTSGEDLAPSAHPGDEKCMAALFPPVAHKLESIHQATNSLSITMCKRAEADCVPRDDNTFLFTIIQHKSFYQYHAVYEPYVMMFHSRAPFEIHAISKKPFWISGRGGPGQGKQPPNMLEAEKKTWWQTEMFYLTSISWKQKGQKYHGYVDDVLFLAFGIEDSKTAGIDIIAGDLLQDMGICALL